LAAIILEDGTATLALSRYEALLERVLDLLDGALGIRAST
jgi:hypothetical protein